MTADTEPVANRPSVVLRDVSLAYDAGQPVVENVNLTVEPGEFVSLVGPSGCGKSTILRLVAGLVSASRGEIQVGNESAAVRSSFVFQDPTLLPWRTVTSNIGLPLELERVPRDERSARITAQRELVGLTEADARKRPAMLSGGMRMRVSLARALVTEPELLLLDEPFGALDDITRGRLNEDLQRIWYERRPTALFVTHNVAEAVYLSRRVFVMSPAPGTIASKIDVPFPFPRAPELRADPDFAALVGDVSRHLRGGVT